VKCSVIAPISQNHVLNQTWQHMQENWGKFTA